MFSRHRSASAGRSRSSSMAPDPYGTHSSRDSTTPVSYGSRSRRDSIPSRHHHGGRSSSVAPDPYRSSSRSNNVSYGHHGGSRSSSIPPSHRRNSESHGNRLNGVFSGFRDLLRGGSSASHGQSGHGSSSTTPNHGSSSRRGSVSRSSSQDDFRGHGDSGSSSSGHHNLERSGGRVRVPGFDWTRDTSRHPRNNYENADHYRRTNSDEGDTTIRNMTNNSNSRSRIPHGRSNLVSGLLRMSPLLSLSSIGRTV